jgi:ribosomal protein L17
MAMEAKVTHLKSHAAEPDSANHRQADYFRKELQTQIDQLDAHVRKCQAKLATYSQRGQVDQVRHMQSHLRNCAIERRELANMLDALARRFSDDEIALAR